MTDDTPLSAVTDRMDDQHGDGQFGATDGAEIRCFTCRRTFPAAGISADELTRLEGESDPADMAAVIPVTCPHCGTGGSLVLNYGPDAGAEESDVLAAMHRDPQAGSPASAVDDQPGGSVSVR